MKQKAATVKKNTHTAHTTAERIAHNGIKNTEELHKIWGNEWQQQQQVIIIVRDNKILIFFDDDNDVVVCCILPSSCRFAGAQTISSFYTMCSVLSHSLSLLLAIWYFFARSFAIAFFSFFFNGWSCARSLTHSLLYARLFAVYIFFFFIMYTCNYRVVKQASDLEKAQTHCHTEQSEKKNQADWLNNFPVNVLFDVRVAQRI